MNIFQTISQVTKRIEPFHSQFFANALNESFEDDQELFREFWSLIMDQRTSKLLPANLKIESEKSVESGRIDVTIYDAEAGLIVGIEVKTTEASSTKGQLLRYQRDLEAKYPETEVRMAYLTPFNESFSPDRATRSIREFQSLLCERRNTRHLSWLQIADIAWKGGGDLWKQHQSYIRDVICIERPSNKRQLDKLFDAQSVTDFWKELEIAAPAQDGGIIDFSEVVDQERLVHAFGILVEASEPDNSRSYGNKITDQLRTKYLSSEYGQIHAGLFDLTQTRWAWVAGTQRYGLRVPHDDHKSSGVSLCTVYTDKIEIPHYNEPSGS